ncbi:MAG: 50S ribosomal protein L29 [bacterium]
MKADELRNMSIEELRVKVRDAKAGLFKLTHQLESRQSEDTSRRMLMKREIARILTVINEKEKGRGVSEPIEGKKVEEVKVLKGAKKPDAGKNIKPKKELKGEKKETKRKVKPKKEERSQKKTKAKKVVKPKKEK